MKRIAFPGWGLEFNIDRTAFTIPGLNLEIQWYGIILAVGMCLAFLLFYNLATKKEKILEDDIYNIALLTVPIGVIGARVAYVINQWDHYRGTGFVNIINLRKGGLAIYGGIIFGLITVLVYCKIKKVKALSVLDALAPGVMLGQAFGRWGNFFNAEAYGWSENIDNLPWRMELDHVVVDGVCLGKACVHPTFLYESLWNLLGLSIILLVVYRLKKVSGMAFFSYLGWYGLGRAFIEVIRADSLYIPGTTLKFSVFVGITCVLAAVIGALVCSKKHKEEVLETAEYISPYAHIVEEINAEENALSADPFNTDEDSADEDCDDEDEEDISKELEELVKNIEENKEEE